MLKELIFTSYQPEVERVHIGVFPASGQYFIKEMRPQTKGVFHTEIELPLGKSYCHYFINNDFQNSVKYASSEDQGGGSHDRIPILLESEIFCPLEFANEGKYLSPINPDCWEIRTVSHHSWIKRVSLVSQQGEFPLKCILHYKNKRYWSLRFSPAECGAVFVLKFSGDTQTRYLHRENRIHPDCHFRDGFSIKSNRSPLPRPGVIPGSVGYQIFPDSFSKAQPLPTSMQLEPWGNPPKLYRHFGGNIKGIKSRLGYLKNLGVDFLYFNPVFNAKSAHRYDCIDYRELDPMLGTKEELKDLIDSVHQLGMKFILDVVVNHCSTDFAPFKEVLEKQEAAQHRDWFVLQSFPVDTSDVSSYLSWGSFSEMPLLNSSQPELRAYLLESLHYWTKEFGIDGWRLDVSTELEVDFVAAISETVRTANPQSTLVGECWYHLNGHRVIEKGKLNGLTNFSLYWKSISPFFIAEKMTVKPLAQSLIKNTWSADWATISHSWTFLSNHDTPRFYSLLKQKEWYPLAFALLYALPGQPVIYYGEEIEMEGLHDPDNRACMDWEKAEKGGEIMQWLQQLNQLRRKFRQLLGEGDLSIVLADNQQDILAIKRSYLEEAIVFIFNFSTQEVKIENSEIDSDADRMENVLEPSEPFGNYFLLAPFSVKILSIQNNLPDEK